jgi:hypothetical protein
MIQLLDNSGGEVTRALKDWRGRAPLPTGLSSAELRELAREERERAVFSARCTSAEFLSELQKVVNDHLEGRSNLADCRWALMRKLKQLGYNPERGFPEDFGRVPPAERGSLQDLSSKQRLDLMIDTNMRITAQRQLYGVWTAGAQTPASPEFAVRARLIQFDTDDTVANAKGTVYYQVSNGTCVIAT